MARFLVLDWDHQQLHVVEANVSRGSVRILRAEVWREEQTPNLAEAAALGQKLRERLKAAGIAAAPVIVSVGRDRVILKDLRIPAVAPHEEPGLVRFQAIKELTDAPDEVVIDYAASTGPGGPQDRRASTLIVRKELLAAYQELCKAAGLRLLGMTPRPFGTLSCLRHMMGKTPQVPAPDPTDAAVASLVIAEHWAEFSVSRGDVLLFSRALTVGPTLAGEVRRNLAVYSGQHAQAPVKAVYVAGSEESATFRERLQDTLGIPVYPFDPVAGAAKVEAPEGSRGGFAGVAGLLYAQASRDGLPINFVQPKQPKPPVDPNRQRVLVAALIAVIVFAFGVGAAYYQIMKKNEVLDRQRAVMASLDGQVLTLQTAGKNYDAIKEWDDVRVQWLNELYDSVAEFPDIYAVRATKWAGDEAKMAGKDKDFVAVMSIEGTSGQESKPLIDTFNKNLVSDPNYKVSAAAYPVTNQGGRNRGQLNFKQTFFEKKRAPDQFTRVIDRSRDRGRRGGAGGGMDFLDGGDGFGGAFDPGTMIPAGPGRGAFTPGGPGGRGNTRGGRGGFGPMGGGQ